MWHLYSLNFTQHFLIGIFHHFKVVAFNLCNLMGFPIHVDTICMGLFIVYYMKMVPQVEFTILMLIKRRPLNLQALLKINTDMNMLRL